MSELAVLNQRRALAVVTLDYAAAEAWLCAARNPDPDDGRYTNAVLTDAGYDLVVATAPGHVSACAANLSSTRLDDNRSGRPYITAPNGSTPASTTPDTASAATPPRSTASSTES